MGVLKHGGKIDVYAIGVTMAEMAPRLNKRNLWERKFSELLEGMKRADPERRLSVMQVLNKLKTLDVDGPDQFGCLPMSKRALELLDNLFTTCGSPPRKKVSPSKRKARSSPRRARESPSKCKTTSNPAPTSPKPTSNRSSSTRKRTRASPSSKSSRKRQRAPPIITPVLPQRKAIVSLITTATIPVVEAIPLKCKQEISTKIQKKIVQAAEIVIASGKTRGIYKRVCMQLKLNMDSNGKYLGSAGDHYKRIQTAVRTLRRRLTNETLTNNTVVKGPTKLQQVTDHAHAYT